MPNLCVSRTARACQREDALLDGLCAACFSLTRLEPLAKEALRADQIAKTCRENWKAQSDRLQAALRARGPAFTPRAEFFKGLSGLPETIRQELRDAAPAFSQAARDHCLDCFLPVAKCECVGGSRVSARIDPVVAAATRQKQQAQAKKLAKAASKPSTSASRSPRRHVEEEW